MDSKRFEQIDRALDSSTRMRLNRLRDFLNVGKASVMVGSGFSKNAEMAEDVRMKNWNELCEDFYAALYNSRPDDGALRLKSALRLAQQIESTMGRAALDEIIKNSLPDDSISPGFLHEQLVGLKWRDIFTTNYDTLLERAAVNAYCHYNVVTSKDSLIYQQHPRIVKLHGSFPDNRPFIITEEDYRTYPERFPEFVNTIRQALIETQFCLIGFSGDDPNFLSWLGWFRDIMGNQMRPLYMVYVGPRPHDSEIKLLNSRKVEPIVTDDISCDPVEAMEFILSYIGNKFTKDEGWSGRLKIQSPQRADMKDLIGQMRRIRETYPGWMVLPPQRIENEFDDCRSDFLYFDKKYSELDDSDKLDFLYEYTWRLRMSLMPSWFNREWYIKALKEALGRYDTLEADDKKKADYLSAAFLQIQRIVGDADFMKNLMLFRDRISQNNSSLLSRLKYEEALWNLTHCYWNSLDKVLASWDIKTDDYRGALWKSKILAESGKEDEAAKILEDSLGDARRKLMSDSGSVYLATAVALISDCLMRNWHSHSFYTNTDKDVRIEKYIDMCYREMRTEVTSGVSHSHGFNIGSHSTTWSTGPYGYFMKYVGAGRYYLMAEACGLPVGAKHVTHNSDVNKLALPLIAEISPDAALLYLVESNDGSAMKTTVSRKLILSMSAEHATELFDSWMKLLEFLDGSYMTPDERERECKVIIPTLARLCVWLDTGRTVRMIHLIWKLYDYVDMPGLLTTCYNSLPPDKAEAVCMEALERPILPGNDIIRPDVPLRNWRGSEKIVDIIVEGLSSESSEIRQSALNRFCDVRNVLSQTYKDAIDEAILKNFDRLDDSNFMSILGVDMKPGEDRVWKEKFTARLQERLDKFAETDFKIAGSSISISDFESCIITFIDCSRHLTAEMTKRICGIILEFITVNFDVLKDTEDSDSFWGGLKRYLDSAMSYAGMLICRMDISCVQSRIKDELLKNFIQLRDKYVLLEAIYNLSFNYETGKGISRENLRFLKNCIETDTLSHKSERISDAFSTFVKLRQSCGRSFTGRGIVKTVIDYLRYQIDSTTGYVLFYLYKWIESEVIDKGNLRLLFSNLSSLLPRITAADDIPAELKSDILYYGCQLAGLVSRIDFKDVDKTECVETWRIFAESEMYPLDIRNGFWRGRLPVCSSNYCPL